MVVLPSSVSLPLDTVTSWDWGSIDVGSASRCPRTSEWYEAEPDAPLHCKLSEYWQTKGIQLDCRLQSAEWNYLGFYRSGVRCPVTDKMYSFQIKGCQYQLLVVKQLKWIMSDLLYFKDIISCFDEIMSHLEKKLIMSWTLSAMLTIPVDNNAICQ